MSRVSLRSVVFALFILTLSLGPVFAVHASAEAPECGTVPEPVLDEADIAAMQKEAAGLPVGGRIAFWAEAFIGTPYDTDPLGAYVRSEKVVCDSEIDCMYLVFRAAELATSETPEGAFDRALELRFITRGLVKDGKVVNYDERFQYGEDMIASGKWGKDVTKELGDTADVPGTRGRDTITYMPSERLAGPDALARLKDGDIIFFVKDPAKRVVGEVIGHLGIVKLEEYGPVLIHASGNKDRQDKPGGGEVKKVSLRDYLLDTKFIGVQVTRFK